MSNLSELANSLTPEDIIKLVTELGADRYIETDNYIQFPTICHNVDPSEAKMKLYYYKKNKKFHCYTACGDNFNIFTLFERRYQLLGIEYNFFQDIVLKVKAESKISPITQGFDNKYISTMDKYAKQETIVDIPHLNPSLLNIYTFYATPMWLEDGISEETMRQYNIKFSINENKIIIPHYDVQGYLIGIRGRAINPEDVIKGKYMPVYIEGKIKAHPLGYNLYGLNLVRGNIKRKKIAIVGEGEKLPMQYNTMFGHNENIAVATCGSNLTNYQVDLLIKSGAERILIAYDKEGKDWQEQQEYYKKLYNFCKTYSYKCKMGFIYDSQNLLELKDSPTDRGKETYLKLYKGAIWL